ncbi:MAG: acyl-CoA thioester hydrolase YciA [Moritella sp.]|uniref:acyl-CoA thioester hydrolase YciA n=2 Tax=unclassified Moritella TaxID=2637987 RepID=UPI0001568968|nr:acyl-CoA hydrolase [Moritella sp. PE36]NQZ92730.1 acyl-CoA thioester hydrolase YciA [Moritella sp.]PHR88425.1 MAG: acyl-CoA thioester hydrolase YciA [Moritella sp.]
MIMTIPKGQLLTRTLSMPSDCNANGDIFGGWIMSQMDIAGGILAKEVAQGRVATISVDGMTFHKPVAVGDVVCCYGSCTRIGNSSMTIKLEIWVKPLINAPKVNYRYIVTEATFTYVAIDDNGQSRKIERMCELPS